MKISYTAQVNNAMHVFYNYQNKIQYTANKNPSMMQYIITTVPINIGTTINNNCTLFNVTNSQTLTVTNCNSFQLLFFGKAYVL